MFSISLTKSVPKGLLMLVSMSCFVGCGSGAQAPEQSIQAPVSPTYPKLTEHVLGLNPNTSEIGYGGTTLIFNEAARPKDLAEILQASLDSRKAWAEAKKFEVEKRYKDFYTETGVFAAAIQDMKAELRSFEKQARNENPLSLEQQTENANDWITRKLNELYLDDNPEKQRALFLWNRYCDAKVLELASHSQFAITKYSERPSPMQFCENYFKENGFFEGPSCQLTDKNNDFFSCLWEEGVFKTWWFKSLYFNSDPAHPIEDGAAEIIRSLLESEKIDIFRSILSLDESAIDLSKGPVRKRILGPDGTIKTYFSDIVLKQIDQGKICSLAIKQLSEFCSIFQVKWPKRLLNESTAPIEQDFTLTPFETISLIEGSDASLDELFQFPSLPGSQNISMKELISYVGTRINHSLSESDRIFHQSESKSTAEQGLWPAKIVAKMGEIQALLSDTLYGSLSSKDQAEVEMKKRKIYLLTQNLEQGQQLNEYYQAQITSTTDRGFQAGYLPNAAHAFIETRLKISNREGVIRVYLWFKGYEDQAVLSCYDIASQTTLPADTCQRHPLDSVAATQIQKAASLTVNPNSGRIDFTIELIDPKLIGLGFKARVDLNKMKPDSFMELKESQLEGRQLVFELFPNRLMDHLEILSGKAFIREDGIDMFEAGVSLWDQNL